MKTAILGTMLLAATLAAQFNDDPAALKRFASSLSALNNNEPGVISHKERIANDISSLAEEGNRPSQPAVEALAESLTIALTGRLTDRQATRVAVRVRDILHCEGMPPSIFRESIAITERELVSFGVSPDASREVTDKLATVGNEIRGPEDIPLLAEPLEK